MELVAMMMIMILEVVGEVMDFIEIVVDELVDLVVLTTMLGSGWISRHMVGNPPISAAKKYKICPNTHQILSLLS